MNISNARELLSKGLSGDFIQVRRRGKSYGHSMILVSRDSGGITVFDCNSDGKNGVKKYYVTWQRFYNKNSAMSLYQANNNNGSAASTFPSAPSSANQSSLPSITDVGIDSIDYLHVSFHFTANNARMARVVIESRNTGKSITRDNTSGLGRVSHEFNVSEFPGTTEMNILIYAYTSTNGGNEVLHRILYGNIPGVVQLPQGDEQIAELYFDHIFYLTTTETLKQSTVMMKKASRTTGSRMGSQKAGRALQSGTVSITYRQIRI